MVIGERMFNTTASQNLPPINVTFSHPLISVMVRITPSPDWFVGFSDFSTINPVTQTYYSRFVIQSFFWDCGTDGGETYTALDMNLDPIIPISQFTLKNLPPLKPFLDPTGTYIPIPAEFECVLRVGDGEVYPGHPFNESQIRPPLYVPREDDFINGMPPPQVLGLAPRKNTQTTSSGGTAGPNLSSSRVIMHLSLLTTTISSFLIMTGTTLW